MGYRSPRFSQDLDNHRLRFQGVDAIVEEVFFLLSHTPWIGDPLRVAPDFRVLRTVTEYGQAFWVLYSYDNAQVYMHSIEPVLSE